MTFAKRHLLGIEPLHPTEITALLDHADRYAEMGRGASKHGTALEGLTQINMFFEKLHPHAGQFRTGGQASRGRRDDHVDADQQREKG